LEILKDPNADFVEIITKRPLRVLECRGLKKKLDSLHSFFSRGSDGLTEISTTTRELGVKSTDLFRLPTLPGLVRLELDISKTGFTFADTTIGFPRLTHLYLTCHEDKKDTGEWLLSEILNNCPTLTSIGIEMYLTPSLWKDKKYDNIVELIMKCQKITPITRLVFPKLQRVLITKPAGNTEMDYDHALSESWNPTIIAEERSLESHRLWTRDYEDELQG
jgi:hypothetical protein